MSKDLTAAMDKNVFYRTNEIFNNTFKKRVKLEFGDVSKTDCKTLIHVNGKEKRQAKVVEYLGEMGERHNYLLSCGHTLKSTVQHAPHKSTNCGSCAQDRIYSSFEHEWQHVIFKSDPDAVLILSQEIYAKFVAKGYLNKSDQLRETQVRNLVFGMSNALDDLRCNHLWGKVYLGSAKKIRKRWRWYSRRSDHANNLIAYTFAIGLGLESILDPNSRFTPMFPILKWATKEVLNKGFANSLLVTRIAIEKCLELMLHQIQQQPQSSGLDTANPPPQQTQDDSQDSPDQPDDITDSGSQEIPTTEEVVKTSPITVQPSAVEATKAVDALVRHAAPTTDDHEHWKEPSASIGIQSHLAASRASTKPMDPSQVESALEEGNDEVEEAIEQLQTATSDVSKESTLVSKAKAAITLIDVKPRHTDKSNTVILSAEDQYYVNRIAAMIIRMLGRKKRAVDEQGTFIDIDAAIQNEIAPVPQTNEIFSAEQVQHGFAYKILCDMSGSMVGEFNRVCLAAEMLKNSLSFPFVQGNLWGFRGGESTQYTKIRSGEVWIYRYDKECSSYVGKAGSKYPIRCGGTTPMHAALHVALKDLEQMPENMSKSLYLLTDGSPYHSKINGGNIPEYFLRQVIRKEIDNARKKSINVHALIIGSNTIPDFACRIMFGKDRYWHKVKKQQVGEDLFKLITNGFKKYLARV